MKISIKTISFRILFYIKIVYDETSRLTWYRHIIMDSTCGDLIAAIKLNNIIYVIIVVALEMMRAHTNSPI